MKQITKQQYNEIVDGLENYNVTVTTAEQGKSTAIQIGRKKIAYKSAIANGEFIYFDTRVPMSKRAANNA